MDWLKQQLANVAGTQEPIYGPSAIKPVGSSPGERQWTELTKDGVRWAAMDSTSVETQTFYITADNGLVGMAQVIYSNVAGIRTTVQFNSKISYPDRSRPNLWASDPLKNVGFDTEKYSFHADNCLIELSEDGCSYKIKSTTSKLNIVDITFTKAAPGFVVGNDGTSLYGIDLDNPWGSMRHAFWPRCNVEGSFITSSGEISMKGRGLFIHALQGMKPHHAAARWNFANFQSPTYSAIMMELTTPPSYGSTVVNVGGIAVDDKILYAGTGCTAAHTVVKGDEEANWPEPGSASFQWKGTGDDMQDFSAELSGDIEERIDRVDIMAEVPYFIKQIVAGAAGTRPYIYQYTPKLTLKLKHGGEDIEEKGQLFMESTFIS